MQAIGKTRWVMVAIVRNPRHPVRSSWSRRAGPDDKSLSPYFAFENADPSVDPLPLQATNVKVRVLGVIAEVVVTQQYKNEGQVPLEAVDSGDRAELAACARHPRA